MKSLCGIPDPGVLEIGADPLWGFADCGHVILGGGLQFRFCPHRHFTADSVLHIGVEALVGIEFRRITRQIEQLDAICPLGEPGLYGLRMMGTQIIENEKDLLGRILDQRFEKFDQPICAEACPREGGDYRR